MLTPEARFWIFKEGDAYHKLPPSPSEKRRELVALLAAASHTQATQDQTYAKLLRLLSSTMPAAQKLPLASPLMAYLRMALAKLTKLRAQAIAQGATGAELQAFGALPDMGAARLRALEAQFARVQEEAAHRRMQRMGGQRFRV